MIIAATLAATGVLSLAAQQQPVFKGDTRTVAVYATVTDKGGRLVPDLTREDFEIKDNNKPQEITVFSNDPQPITAVVMIDRSGSMRATFDLVQRAAEEFVRALDPTDKARVGSFSTRIQIDPPDFTSDHGKLLDALRTELKPEGPTPLWNAVDKAISALASEEGRRVVVVFTDGVDKPMNFSGGNSSLKDVKKRAERTNIMVYAIGLAGQTGMPGGGGGAFGGLGGRGLGGGQPSLEQPDEGLKEIAAETGGGYFELMSPRNLPATFRRVAEELHHQYALGFTPTVLDGKTHKLSVGAKGAAMIVRARQSYLASRP